MKDMLQKEMNKMYHFGRHEYSQSKHQLILSTREYHNSTQEDHRDRVFFENLPPYGISERVKVTQ